jgi:hypothetical protein
MPENNEPKIDIEKLKIAEKQILGESGEVPTKLRTLGEVVDQLRKQAKDYESIS